MDGPFPQAHALPDGRVLVSCAATACLALPLLVTDVALEPQLGLVLNGGGAGPGAGAAGDGRGEGGGGGAGQNLAGAVPGLLPLWLAPGATANWAFVLERSAGGRTVDGRCGVVRVMGMEALAAAGMSTSRLALRDLRGVRNATWVWHVWLTVYLVPCALLQTPSRWRPR